MCRTVGAIVLKGRPSLALVIILITELRNRYPVDARGLDLIGRDGRLDGFFLI
jgi:hypothetical protein